jgi:uncharacterized protein (DUF433 family)
MVQGSEHIDLDILKDAIREVIREELDQLAMQQPGTPSFVREANRAAYRVKTPFGAEALASIDSRRSVPEGAWPGSSSRSLGQWIVVDPAICHGKPVFRNTRIMVWQVLELVAQGMAWESIEEQWDGKISKDMIAEAVQLANRSFVQQMNELTRELAVV